MARRRTAGAVLVIALLAACGPAGQQGSGDGPTGVSDRAGDSPSPVASAYPTTGPSTAAALAPGHWTRMAPAPVTARGGAASAWTGRELLVWGGANDTEYGDGAAYDPATDSWRELSPSPLSARTQIASVWTGTQWFLWGGQRGVPAVGDGALYDPAADRWTDLPAGPLGRRGGATAVWDGREVLVWGGWGDGRASSDVVDGAAYDPATRAWRPVPAAPGVPVHTQLDVAAVAAGSEVYVWAQWENTVPLGRNSTTTSFGVTALRFDTNAWTWDIVEANPPVDVRSPVWTGREFLLPAWGGARRGPAPSGLTGHRRAPDAATWAALAHGPVDDCSPATAWTGAALVAAPVNCSGGLDAVRPGDAAAWDPQANRWLALARAPEGGGDVVAWAGDRLLTWGAAYLTGGGFREVGLALRG